MDPNTVRIRSDDDPTAWASDMFKTENGHEFHFIRDESHARHFDAGDAAQIVAMENRRLSGKLEIVADAPTCRRS